MSVPAPVLVMPDVPVMPPENVVVPAKFINNEPPLAPVVLRVAPTLFTAPDPVALRSAPAPGVNVPVEAAVPVTLIPQPERVAVPPGAVSETSKTTLLLGS